MGFIQEFVKFGAMMEGWRAGTVSWKNNNPGNLDAGPKAAKKDSTGYAVYVTVADGWADFEWLVERIIAQHPGITLGQFYAGQRDEEGKVIPGGYSGFAPAKDPRGPNDPNTYARFMALSLEKSYPGIQATSELGGYKPLDCKASLGEEAGKK